MHYELAYNSLTGARPSNQDRVAIAERDNAVLMVVADGLGGHSGGEYAAELLTQSLVRGFQAVKSRNIARPSAFLALAILHAHEVIVNFGRSRRPPIEPRTTCVACLVQDGYACWAHVGDSRLYHFRNGLVLTRTHDHTSVEELRRDGLLSEKEMRDHPYKSRLLKCVGGPNRPAVSLGEEIALARNDVLLLCSDGVWEAHSPERLAHYMASKDLEDGVEDMLEGAQERKHEHCDNISAVALRWTDATVPARARPVMPAVTPAAPLRATESGGADAPRPAETPAEGVSGRKGSVAAEIAEIESFLNEITTRPPRRR